VVPNEFGDIYDVSRGGPKGDPERSRIEATRILQAIADGRLNPLSMIDELDMLEDVAYDFGVDLRVVRAAQEASALVFRDAEGGGGARPACRSSSRAGDPRSAMAVHRE